MCIGAGFTERKEYFCFYKGTHWALTEPMSCGRTVSLRGSLSILPLRVVSHFNCHFEDLLQIIVIMLVERDGGVLRPVKKKKKHNVKDKGFQKLKWTHNKIHQLFKHMIFVVVICM